MSDFSLVPADHQPDFEDVSLVPVDHDPFSADGVTQQAQAQQAQTQPAQPEPQGRPQQPATGADQPGVNGPATGNGPGGSSSSADQANLIKAASSGDRESGDIRQKIVDLASGQIGSGAWDFKVAKGNFGAGKDKCNLFVYDILNEAGASPGLPHGHWLNHYPPTAANWADHSFAIPGWRVLSSGESPQPGDVVGQRIQWPNGATGHVVIVGPNANFIGVGTSEKVESVATKMMGGNYPDPDARPGGLLVYRRYEP